MNAAQFFEAAREAAPKVFGLQLHPFTLAHYSVLSEFRCPFLPEFNESEVTPRDILIALFLCSSSKPDVRVNEFHARSQLYFRFWWWRHFARQSQAAYVREMGKLAGYLRQSFTAPVELAAEPGPESEAPFVLRLMCFLMEELHQPRESARATPVWEARALYAAHLDRKGQLRPHAWTKDRQELWEYAAELDKQNLKN